MTPDRMLDVLFVSPERFRLTPQVGTPCAVTWRDLARWLSHASMGSAKDEAGAWSPALYTGNVRRKAALVRVGALVVDVDERGDLDAVAEAFSGYRAITHETFSSTPEAPRCRLVVALAEPVDAALYEATHAVVRTHLASAAIGADLGAKDASRLSYAPVRRPGAGYRFRVIDGRPLDARALLQAQPPPPQRAPQRLPTPKHRDAYVRGALRRAADAVGGASEGTRHYMLSREAFALARLGLSDAEIADALLPAFLAAAGERREAEGTRTIRDAVRARRGAA